MGESSSISWVSNVSNCGGESSSISRVSNCGGKVPVLVG